MARAITELQARAGEPIGAVAAVAANVGLSEDHFRRRFTQAVGVSPQRFMQALTWADAGARLRASAGVLEAAVSAGLSGPGRLHDLSVTLVAATPGEVAAGGAGMGLQYGFAHTPLGAALLGWTTRGLTALRFVDPPARTLVLGEWLEEWPQAGATEQPAAAQAWADCVFAHWRGEVTGPLAVHVRGTAFQLQVWQALLRVPDGGLVSYQEVARAIGRPTAIRAAASAVGANSLSVLIPCHRVLRQSGALGGYRWGLDRKRQLLAAEAARR